MIPALFIYKIKKRFGHIFVVAVFSSFFLFFIETLWNQSVAEYENKTSRRESKYFNENFRKLPFALLQNQRIWILFNLFCISDFRVSIPHSFLRN